MKNPSCKIIFYEIPKAYPFMGVRETIQDSYRVLTARLSFSGERAYEVFGGGAALLLSRRRGQIHVDPASVRAVAAHDVMPGAADWVAAEPQHRASAIPIET